MNGLKKFLFFDSSSVYADKRKKDILVLGESPTDRLDDTTITAEAKFSITITKSKKKIILSLHYNGGNGFLYAHEVKISHFKRKIQK